MKLNISYNQYVSHTNPAMPAAAPAISIFVAKLLFDLSEEGGGGGGQSILYEGSSFNAFCWFFLEFYQREEN
jgi:hypothetical protein